MSDEQDFLRRSLDDLERERAAGDLSDDDYRDLRARYESRLSRSGSTHPPETGATSTQKRTVWRTVVTVALVGAIGIGAGIGVAAWSGSREPGEQISGGIPASTDERLADAARRFQEGDARGAIELYQEVLDENPDDVEALTYLGWTLRNVSNDDPRLLDAAIGFIEHALEVDPDHAEAWFFRGIIYLRDEDEPEKAVEALRLALANDPIPEIEGAVRSLLAEIAQSSSTTQQP